MKNGFKNILGITLAGITFFLSGAFLLKKARPHVEDFIEKRRNSQQSTH